MRVKVLLSTIVILAVLLAVVALVSRNSSALKDIDATNVEEITFQNTYDVITLTEQADIQKLFENLQSMKFKRTLNYHKFGAAILIDMKLKSGEKISMSILSDDIIINDNNYIPDKDYQDEIRAILNTFSQK